MDKLFINGHLQNGGFYQMTQTLHQQIRTCNMRLLRNKWQQEDPEYRNKINAYHRAYYQKTKEVQIASSNKWNKENKAKRNATRRKLYAKQKGLN